MQHGQTNGIPQGSILMDFIAEIILAYADTRLSERLQSRPKEYLILRYRDDYRIFANSPTDAEYIAQCLAETLVELGMRLNPNKTRASSDIITSSIKADK